MTTLLADGQTTIGSLLKNPIETLFTSEWHPRKADNFKCLRRWGVSLNHEGKTVWIWEQLKTYFPSPAKKKEDKKFEPVPLGYEAKTVPAYNAMGLVAEAYCGTYTQWTAEGLEAARKRGEFWLRHSKPKPLMVLSFKRRLPALYTLVEGKGRRRNKRVKVGESAY